MYSDTHFHLAHMASGGADVPAVLEALAERDMAFGMDIGTEAEDFFPRLRLADEAIGEIEGRNPGAAAKARAFLGFSLGIWPQKEAVEHREEELARLKGVLTKALSDPAVSGRVRAIGEFGLDHHGPQGEAPDAGFIAGEMELCRALLDLARETGLPAVIHSRDAFEETLSCAAASGVTRGVIHCFSYGLPEAKAFLDLGWRLSFSGSITYTKKARLDALAGASEVVFRDRLLFETDSPYLAPHPRRGRPNTPVLVEEVYRYAAGILGLPPEDLSQVVDGNVRELFGTTG